MGHDGHNTNPSHFAQDSEVYVEVTVESTEHLNELNRQAGWEAEYRQLDPGRFRGRFQTREYADLLAVKEIYQNRIEVTCTPPKGTVALLVSLPGDRCAEANSESLGNERVQVIWPGGDTRILFFRPDGGHIVHLDAVAFAESYQQLFPRPAGLPEKGAQVYRCSPDRIRRLRRFVNYLVFSPAGHHDSIERADTLKRILLEAIVDTNDGSYSGARTPLATRRRVALRTREYIEAHFDKPVTMEMLCRHSGVSARTLQRAFMEHFEMNPSHYLKVRRLNAVHIELMRIRDKGHTIARVAMKHGFSHLGRFSRDYKLLFHELPRETLGRIA